MAKNSKRSNSKLPTATRRAPVSVVPVVPAVPVVAAMVAEAVPPVVAVKRPASHGAPIFDSNGKEIGAQ